MINTLVTHSKYKTLGIGCISKELKSSYRVNFGLDDTMTVKKDKVRVVDTSKCKTVTLSEYAQRILNDKSTLNYCIIGNELRQYVGIGWITLRVVTYDDLTKYPRVI